VRCANPGVIKVRSFTNNIFGVQNVSFTPKHHLRDMSASQQIVGCMW